MMWKSCLQVLTAIYLSMLIIPQSMAADAVPSLRERMPADALAYLRLPSVNSLFQVPTEESWRILRQDPHTAALAQLAQQVDNEILKKLTHLIHPALALPLSHSNTPLEVAVLLPSNMPLTNINVLFATHLDFTSYGALNSLVNEIAQATPGFKIQREFSAQSHASFFLPPLAISATYNLDTRELLVLSGPTATLDTFSKILAQRPTELSTHPMHVFEKRVDSHAQGFFQWIDTTRLLPILASVVPAESLAPLKAWGLMDARSVALGWGRAADKGRLEMMLDIPQTDLQATLKAPQHAPTLAIAGEAKVVLGMAFPLHSILAVVEAYVSQTTEQQREKYQNFTQQVKKLTGLSLHEIVSGMGEESILFSDDAGEFMALRVPVSPEQDKFFDFVRSNLASDYETHEFNGVTYHHLVIRNLNPWELKPAAISGKALDNWMESLLAKIGNHFYWVREGDYLIFAQLPQMLRDRQNYHPHTPLGEWLRQHRNQNIDHALFYVSTALNGSPRHLYHTWLAMLQMLADISDAQFDAFALPSANELNLPHTGTYGIQLDIQKNLLALGMTFESNPLEFLLSQNAMSSVVVIGVMAAVAIPAYTDYLRRSKVMEAVTLLTSIKTPAEEFFATHGELPSVEEIDAPSSGKYTASVRLNDARDGYEATLKDDSISGKVTLHFDADNAIWTCGNEGMNPAYLPTSCK